MTDYLICAETAASSLKTIGEQVSDGLLISMILKGLPDDYKAFVVVVTQSDREHNFQEFKLALCNFEETKHTRTNNENSISVMKTKGGRLYSNNNNNGGYNRNNNVKY